MSDLLEVLPDFDTKPYTHLFHSLTKNEITVLDLITLDPKEIARRCPLPSADVAKLCAGVICSLQGDLKGGLRKRCRISPPTAMSGVAVRDIVIPAHDQSLNSAAVEDTDILKDVDGAGYRHSLLAQNRVKTLDPLLDEALGGGFQTGHISEIVGESSVGKTQFVMGLLLSAQLAPPRGLGKGAMFVSTEAKLNTKRLLEMLNSHPEYQKLDPSERPSMDFVHTTNTNDLEAQEHILRYQLPVAVERYNIGLVVIDSVAANFRAEHQANTPAGLRERALDLRQLGSILRRVAVESNVAVLVTNQVFDRFDDPSPKSTLVIRRSLSPAMSSSPAARGSQAAAAISEHRTETHSLAHQQRFFTGWGDRTGPRHESLKNPALGLAWANQLSARVVLKMEGEHLAYSGGNIWKDRKKSRSLAVVFAPWAAPTDPPVAYDITQQGVVSVSGKEDAEFTALSDQHPELLNPEFWRIEDDDAFA